MATIADFPMARVKRGPSRLIGEASVIPLDPPATPIRAGLPVPLEDAQHTRIAVLPAATTFCLVPEELFVFVPVAAEIPAFVPPSQRKNLALEEVVWRSIPEMREEAAELKELIDSLEQSCFVSAKKIAALQTLYDKMMTRLEAMCAAF